MKNIYRLILGFSVIALMLVLTPAFKVSADCNAEYGYSDYNRCQFDGKWADLWDFMEEKCMLVAENGPNEMAIDEKLPEDIIDWEWFGSSTSYGVCYYDIFRQTFLESHSDWFWLDLYVLCDTQEYAVMYGLEYGETCADLQYDKKTDTLTVLRQWCEPHADLNDIIDEWHACADDIFERAGAYLIDEANTEEEIYWMSYRIAYELCRNCDYDDVAAESLKGEHPRAFTALGAVVDGEAVCTGMAQAYSYLMNRCGIECIVVYSDNHAWNNVRIGDEWFSVDITAINVSGTFGAETCAVRVFDFFDNENSATLFEKSKNAPVLSTSTRFRCFNMLGTDCFESKDMIDSSEYASLLETVKAAYPQYADYLPADKWICIYPTNWNQKPLLKYISELGYAVDFDHYAFRLDTFELTPETIDIMNNGTSSEALTVATGDCVSLYACPNKDGSPIDTYVEWIFSDDSAFEYSFPLNDFYHEEITFKCLKAGTYTLTAKSVYGDIADTITLTVTGDNPTPSTGSAIIWAAGNKEHKAYEIKTSLTATNWTDTKGKTKVGKLVWLVMNEKTDIAYDSVKHTVTTKSNATKTASVSKGKVTAKKPGTVYVYAIDTGSMTSEEFIVTIKQSAKKISFVESAQSTEIVKKASVTVGETSSLYISPSAGKDAEVSTDCTYTADVAKDTFKINISVNGLTKDNGAYKLSFTGLLAKGTKTASTKITVVNTESGKKGTLTVVVEDPVTSLSAEYNGKLAKKADTETVPLNIVSCNGDEITTDKIKLYVSSSEVTVSSNGKKVTCAASKEVKATLSKDMKSITLKASKDLAQNVTVYAAVTNAVTKQIKIYPLFEVKVSEVPAE